MGKSKNIMDRPHDYSERANPQFKARLLRKLHRENNNLNYQSINFMQKLQNILTKRSLIGGGLAFATGLVIAGIYLTTNSAFLKTDTPNITQNTEVAGNQESDITGSNAANAEVVEYEQKTVQLEDVYNTYDLTLTSLKGSTYKISAKDQNKKGSVKIQNSVFTATVSTTPGESFPQKVTSSIKNIGKHAVLGEITRTTNAQGEFVYMNDYNPTCVKSEYSVIDGPCSAMTVGPVEVLCKSDAARDSTECDQFVLNMKISRTKKALSENNTTPKTSYKTVINSTEAVKYEPNPDKYVGFKICDNKKSTCEVYGIEASKLSKVVLGAKYKISFNNIGKAGAAAGTTYIEVVGNVDVIAINSESSATPIVKKNLSTIPIGDSESVQPVQRSILIPKLEYDSDIKKHIISHTKTLTTEEFKIDILGAILNIKYSPESTVPRVIPNDAVGYAYDILSPDLSNFIIRVKTPVQTKSDTKEMYYYVSPAYACSRSSLGKCYNSGYFKDYQDSSKAVKYVTVSLEMPVYSSFPVTQSGSGPDNAINDILVISDYIVSQLVYDMNKNLLSSF